MKQAECYVVGTLGLPEQELRMVKNMLRLTASRAHGCYEIRDGADISACDMAIVNADDWAAMEQWKEAALKERHPLPILVSSDDTAKSTVSHFHRPLSPTKLLAMLDRLTEDIQLQDPTQQIFAGRDRVEVERTPLAASSMQSHRALVVDDSPTVRKQLELELKASNIHVDSVETGELGLDLIERNTYDIIFLDVVLPGADGYQVCKSIKKNPAARQTPVVMLTSKSSPFDRVRGSLAGCDTYLTKPVDYERFRQVLEEYKV